MKLTFQIEYHTGWGESMYIIGSLPVFSQGVRMAPLPDGTNTITIEVPPAQSVFTYRYELRRDNGTARREWGRDREMRFDPHLSSALIIDRWKDVPSNKPFFSSAFTEAIFRHPDRNKLPSTVSAQLEIRVDAPAVMPGKTLAMAGSCTTLGNWNPETAPALTPIGNGQWSIHIPLSGLPHEFEYKFVIRDIIADKSSAIWENGNNRRLTMPATPDNGTLIITGLFLESPTEAWRGAGTAIPVFSLRSCKGLGTGEFADLAMMVDWAVETGQSFIQLLPVNDTTMTHSWTDSYPYTTNSTFALHPMYLRIQDVGELPTQALKDEFEHLRQELNALPELDYERVNNAKRRFTRILFETQGTAEMTSPDFKNFAIRNDFWLLPYAAWCVLRDFHHTPDMDSWGRFSVYTPEKIEEFIKENRHEIDYVRFIQYHLDKQLRRVRDYAASHGVAIKGDIPIGISRCSVDAWMHPELFNLDCTAGAPPDDFARLGQNWGFPTYRWDIMALDGFRWWRKRLQKMAEYFSAYRIDHLLGFFRIWQIPADTLHGILGVFCPALPFTPQELTESYGFELHPRLHTTPFISEETLTTLAGDMASEARSHYLDTIAPGHYALKPEFASQTALSRHFSTREASPGNKLLCEGLMNMIDQVLFIEDPCEPGKYHPRIEGASTFTYKALSEEQRKAYDTLYEDFFYHRHNQFWKQKAMEKLPPLIDSTGMLSCAEDLGMIPACVPSVMDALKILSLEIQRMPKEFGVRFGNPADYPYLSVCSTSTHDMPGLRQWWEEDHERASEFYRSMLHHCGKAPAEATPEVCAEILAMNLASPAMLCILPLQDWLSVSDGLRRKNPEEEQINIPAVSRHYWRYRMHLTLESLIAATDFNATVRHLIAGSGR